MLTTRQDVLKQMLATAFLSLANAKNIESSVALAINITPNYGFAIGHHELEARIVAALDTNIT